MTIKERMCYHAFSSEAMVLQGVPWGCVYILRIFFQRGGKQGLSPLLSFFFFCSLIYLMYLFQTKNTHNLLTTHTHTRTHTPHTTHERERKRNVLLSSHRCPSLSLRRWWRARAHPLARHHYHHHRHLFYLLRLKRSLSRSFSSSLLLFQEERLCRKRAHHERARNTTSITRQNKRTVEVGWPVERRTLTHLLSGKQSISHITSLVTWKQMGVGIRAKDTKK